MRHLLAPETLSVLEFRARANTLLAFDFDGTLAPLVADPEQAHMRPETAALFTRVCALYPCAVISGRSRDDVAGRLRGAAVRYVIGNHGMETGLEDLPMLAAPIARARTMLASALADEEGVAIEDKRFSLSLHYRNAASRQHAQAAILKAVGTLPDELRVVGGELVINLLPRGAANKGDSLLDLMAREKVGNALFAGDDVTDEDAFGVDSSERLTSVRVGWSRDSAAAYFVRDQFEMDDLLARLVSLREATYGS